MKIVEDEILSPGSSLPYDFHLHLLVIRSLCQDGHYWGVGLIDLMIILNPPWVLHRQIIGLGIFLMIDSYWTRTISHFDYRQVWWPCLSVRSNSKDHCAKVKRQNFSSCNKPLVLKKLKGLHVRPPPKMTQKVASDQIYFLYSNNCSSLFFQKYLINIRMLNRCSVCIHVVMHQLKSTTFTFNVLYVLIYIKVSYPQCFVQMPGLRATPGICWTGIGEGNKKIQVGYDVKLKVDSWRLETGDVSRLMQRCWDCKVALEADGLRCKTRAEISINSKPEKYHKRCRQKYCC